VARPGFFPGFAAPFLPPVYAQEEERIAGPPQAGVGTMDQLLFASSSMISSGSPPKFFLCEMDELVDRSPGCFFFDVSTTTSPLTSVALFANP